MREKKIRTNIPKVNKIRAELQKEISSNCPFCDSTEVGHFEIHHMDENPINNDTGNLLLVCPTCHSKITKDDIKQVDVFRKKIELLKAPEINKQSGQKTVNFNNKVDNAIIGDNHKISLYQQKKTVKQKYPEGCIGFDANKANYISHLINRFNDYKEYEVGKGKVNYAIFSSHLKKYFKIGSTRTIYNLHIDKFDELVNYIHSRIDGTKLARVKGYKHKNYSTYFEYTSE
jgi:hypothetical protein